MTAQLDELYFSWLYSKVRPVKLDNPKQSYWNLCKQLYSKEFLWLIPNDDNRAADGIALRDTFLTETKYSRRGVSEWLDLGCSFLEMLIALAQRMEFDTDRPAEDWVFDLLMNVGLDRFNDARWRESDAVEVGDAIDKVIFRTYSYDGTGGLLPLTTPADDQRTVEIWYQMSEYLLEWTPEGG